MPRPLRIEYENAFYHVMNRGRGRQTIFHGPTFYQAFLDVLAQSHERFGVIVHAYCLMGNHYHLLLQTPQANLSRVMQHINGLYTQRYNRLKHTDGPLFRGRYKAVLVDADAYLLQVSRYIHRNPIETTKPLVPVLEHYSWSSYPAFIGKQKAPVWLDQEMTYRMLGQRQRQAGYRAFIEAGVDEETARFYTKGNMAAVIGDRVFREQLIENNESVQQTAKKSDRVNTQVYGKPVFGAIIDAVSQVFKIDRMSIIRRQKGRQRKNLPRKVAMYLCQSRGYSLKEIVEKFDVAHVGSVSNAISAVRQALEDDEAFRKKVEKLQKII